MAYRIYAIFIIGAVLGVEGIAKAASVPYLASLELRGKPHCAAVIIDTRFVLTPEHCVLNVEELTVRAGPLDDVNEVQVRKVVKPFYTSDAVWGLKVAVLKLESELNLNEFTQKIEMAQSFEDAEKSLTLYSFEKNENTLKVLEADITLAEEKQCKELFKDWLVNDKCATGSDTKQQSGVAGGPLVKRNPENSGKDLLLGIIISSSNTNNEFSTNKPLLFASIPDVRELINTIISSY